MSLFHRHRWKILSSSKITRKEPSFDMVGELYVKTTAVTSVVLRCRECGDLETKELFGHFDLEADGA